MGKKTEKKEKILSVDVRSIWKQCTKGANIGCGIAIRNKCITQIS